MKINKTISIFLISILLLAMLSGCKTHKDCRGRKKTTKTAMGGWL